MTKGYLEETASEYIERYKERLAGFLNEFETNEADFIKKELEYLTNTLYDLEQAEASTDGYSTTGIENFLLASEICNKIGWQKFLYSTKSKISFLENQEKVSSNLKKIKNLFLYIEFLHSNIEHFKQFDDLIKKLLLLENEKRKLKHRDNFRDKLKYEELQSDLIENFKIIQDEIINPVQSKAIELNICNPLKTDTLWNWNIGAISYLKENFSHDDIPEILNHKTKYIEYRELTNFHYFLKLFFNDLDEILKVLFDFFKETEKDEFESFQTKSIQADNLFEVSELIQKGYTEFTLPISGIGFQEQAETKTLKPQEKLSDLITHDKSVEIVKAIKIQYKNIKGKRLKLLLLAFQDLGLLPKERIAKKFHESCYHEFDWNIASYTAMNGYSFIKDIDEDEFNDMKKHLESLLNTE